MSYRLSGRITVTLVCFKKRMAPSRQWNGTTGRKKNLAFSCDETKHETTSPEQDHSIASERSNIWAECRDKKSVGTEPAEKNVSW